MLLSSLIPELEILCVMYQYCAEIKLQVRSCDERYEMFTINNESVISGRVFVHREIIVADIW